MREQRKQWMADATAMFQVNHTHWTRYQAKLRRVAGRRARRLMLKHGLWDPRYPVPVDTGSTAFYYNNDSGVEDPTLLSSDDEGKGREQGGAGGGNTGHTSGTIREEASIADDNSEFVMAEGPDVLVLSPKVVRTPGKAAAIYSNAVSGALQMGNNVNFVTEASGGGVPVISMVDRFKINSSAVPKRNRTMSRVGGDGTPRQPRKVPLPGLRHPEGSLKDKEQLLDSSYVRMTLPEFDPRNAAKALELLESRPATEEALMTTPLSPTRATVNTKPQLEGGAQTGYESNSQVDSLLPRRLASLYRRLAAVDAPPLPPELGYLQRMGRQGTVCAHAFRVASGAVHSDSESDCDDVIEQEVSEITNRLNPNSQHFESTVEDGTTQQKRNGLLELCSNDTVRSIVRPDAVNDGDTSSDSAEVIISGGGVGVGGGSGGGSGGGKPIPGQSRGIEAKPSSTTRKGDADITMLAMGFNPEVGDGTGYKGLGVGSFLTAKKGWNPVGMGLVNSTVPSQLLSEVEDSGSWGTRPKGLLLASCKPHNGPVTDLVTAQDHSFFVSGSSDATVHVWFSKNINRFDSR